MFHIHLTKYIIFLDYIRRHREREIEILSVSAFNHPDLSGYNYAFSFFLFQPADNNNIARTCCCFFLIFCFCNGVGKMSFEILNDAPALPIDTVEKDAWPRQNNNEEGWTTLHFFFSFLSLRNAEFEIIFFFPMYLPEKKLCWWFSRLIALLLFLSFSSFDLSSIISATTNDYTDATTVETITTGSEAIREFHFPCLFYLFFSISSSGWLYFDIIFFQFFFQPLIHLWALTTRILSFFHVSPILISYTRILVWNIYLWSWKRS
jgi:hypothetical protein